MELLYTWSYLYINLLGLLISPEDSGAVVAYGDFLDESHQMSGP